MSGAETTGVLLTRTVRQHPDGTCTVRVRGVDRSPFTDPPTHPPFGGVLRWQLATASGIVVDGTGCPDCGALALNPADAGHVPGAMICSACGSEFTAGAEATS